MLDILCVLTKYIKNIELNVLNLFYTVPALSKYIYPTEVYLFIVSNFISR